MLSLPLLAGELGAPPERKSSQGKRRQINHHGGHLGQTEVWRNAGTETPVLWRELASELAQGRNHLSPMEETSADFLALSPERTRRKYPLHNTCLRCTNSGWPICHPELPGTAKEILARNPPQISWPAFFLLKEKPPTSRKPFQTSHSVPAS